MKLLGQYQNGNYTVRIYDDGTKVRENDLDFFAPAFPESMDIKITNYCDMGCPFCHEDSSVSGKHGDIMNLKFIDTLHPYTEMAIGGGNPLAHPQLVPFLEKLKERHIIPSMTVNQKHFMDNLELLKDLTGRQLIYGLGVSLVSVDDKFLTEIRQFPNAVLHVINGVVSIPDIVWLAKRDLKVLILGYKDFRRGVQNHANNVFEINRLQKCLYNVLPTAVKDGWFKTISFDNLAIKQLDVKRLMSEDEWNKFYMGDDGGFTMYVDAVSEVFAVSSVSTKRHWLMDDIKDMFAIVQEDAGKK